MARRGDHADIEFFFRFIIEPFRDIRWAVAYSAIGIVFCLLDSVLIGDLGEATNVTSPVAMLSAEFGRLARFRFLLPAMCFNAVGMLGMVTVVVREWLVHRR